MTDDIFEVRYRGPITVGSPGRAQLTDRPGGISQFIWTAMVEAGWRGRTPGLGPILEFVIRVPPADGPGTDRLPPVSPRPGGRRRQRKGARIGEDGVIWQHYVGPLCAVAPQLSLAEDEASPEHFDSFEDMLYSVTVRAGWLADGHEQAGREVPDADIAVRVTRVLA